MKQDTIYIKMEQNATVKNECVKISDIATVYGIDEAQVNRIKSIKVLTFSKQKTRYIVSSMYVIKLIMETYPNVTVSNIGETDALVEYKQNGADETVKWIEYVKVAFICVIIFFGAAFAIMTFNTDVNTRDLFEKVYLLFTGKETDRWNIIEIMYSIGLAVGIIVFYNHFGCKKITIDPTPIEVEMRKYEKDINTTIIEGVKREECHKEC